MGWKKTISQLGEVPALQMKRLDPRIGRPIPLLEWRVRIDITSPTGWYYGLIS